MRSTIHAGAQAMTFVQPPRENDDGDVTISRDGELLRIAVTHAGVTTTTVLSAYNAFVVFGMLSLMLNIKLPAKIGQRIFL